MKKVVVPLSRYFKRKSLAGNIAKSGLPHSPSFESSIVIAVSGTETLINELSPKTSMLEKKVSLMSFSHLLSSLIMMSWVLTVLPLSNWIS